MNRESSISTRLTPGARTVRIDGPFRMRHGGVLPELQVAYETWGELSPAGDNAVLIFTGLSPSAHAASSAADPASGWWEDMLGPGKALDTERLFVVCVNSLGSCFGTTGPASIDPRTGQPYRLTFPLLTLEDVAVAGHEVIGALGLESLRAVVGPSMGGMTALAYCLLYPETVRGLVSISSAARARPFAIALRSLQREIIRNDPAWQGGEYPPDRQPIRGMQLARKLGMITYRSAEEWKQRFGRQRVSEQPPGRELFGIEFEVESYLEAQARKFTGGFDANCYLYLSHAMDLFDATEHGGGSLRAAFAKLRLEHALVIGVETDFLFPLEQQRTLARFLKRKGREVRLKELSSIQGHDSFLVDMDRFRPVIAEFFTDS